MNDDQPTQPLNDERLAQIRDAVDRRADHYSDRLLLLAEVDRLRAELANLRTVLITAHEAGMSLGQDVERLQSQRDVLVRKLGLDWGPDEFGDLDAVTHGQQSCGDASIWSCALGDHCVCKKTKHGGRHECACGSWWFRDK